jgi:hypothetical protein
VTVPILLILTGCGGPKPVKVEGIVTLDGQPVENAAVVFQPGEGDRRAATGTTGGDGVFHLTTFSPDDGALPGDYKVLVTRSRPVIDVLSEKGVNVGPDHSMGDAFKAAAQLQKMKKPPIDRYALPADYGNLQKTPLKITVPVSGRARIELRSAGAS